jgi:hypothetical protein
MAASKKNLPMMASSLRAACNLAALVASSAQSLKIFPIVAKVLASNLAKTSLFPKKVVSRWGKSLPHLTT